MPIEFRCTSCGKLLRVKDEAAGKQAKCPECETVLQVPIAEAGAAPAPTPPPAPTAAEATHGYAPNPYASPVADDTGRGGDYHTASGHRSGVVTAVAIVNFVVGGLELACGTIFAIAGGTAADWMGVALEAAAEQDPNFDMDIGIAPEIIGGMIIVMGLFIAAIGLPTIIAGYGVIRRRKWGRILTLVLGGISAILAVLALVSLSILGVAICGGYTALVYSVLLQRQYAEEFS